MHDDKPKPAGRFSQHYRGEPQPAAMVPRAEHERRVTELLEANNRYLERARAAEAGIADARAAERKACAQIADADDGLAPGGNPDFGPNVARRIAAAIRPRAKRDMATSPCEHAPMAKVFALPLKITASIAGISQISESAGPNTVHSCGRIVVETFGEDHEEEAHAIARAVNAHDGLLAALRELVDCHEPVKPTASESRIEANDRWHARRNAAFTAARGEIAKAEGRTHG
jgi:hypothetical protein